MCDRNASIPSGGGLPDFMRLMFNRDERTAVKIIAAAPEITNEPVCWLPSIMRVLNSFQVKKMTRVKTRTAPPKIAVASLPGRKESPFQLLRAASQLENANNADKYKQEILERPHDW